MFTLLRQIFVRTIGAFCALILSFNTATAVDAESKQLVVVELFTSQGCSSCPPADRTLAELDGRDDIIALSWSVDYWDRFGWQDTFALPNSTMRQMRYNQRFGVSGVYTPQMVFNGRTQGAGSRHNEVLDAVAEAKSQGRQWFQPQLSLDGSKVRINLPAAKGAEKALVRLVYYTAKADVEVEKGENRGRSLHYTNVVRSTEIGGTWNGSAQILTANPDQNKINGADHLAVLIESDAEHGEIIGAARVKLQ